MLNSAELYEERAIVSLKYSMNGFMVKWLMDFNFIAFLSLFGNIPTVSQKNPPKGWKRNFILVCLCDNNGEAI